MIVRNKHDLITKVYMGSVFQQSKNSCQIDCEDITYLSCRNLCGNGALNNYTPPSGKEAIEVQIEISNHPTFSSYRKEQDA